jgi:hypothetical protein
MKDGDLYYSIHGCDADGWRLVVYKWREYTLESGERSPSRDYLVSYKQERTFNTLPELLCEVHNE